MSEATENMEPDPDEVARRSAEALWAGDWVGVSLGMRIIDVGPGYATLAMTVTEEMTNGLGQAHGGFIFLLADTAFGLACNSRGDKSVAQHCQISFLRPGRLGDLLVANAHEVFQEGRSGLYDINVSVGDETIAEFRGASRTIGGRWV